MHDAAVVAALVRGDAVLRLQHGHLAAPLDGQRHGGGEPHQTAAGHGDVAGEIDRFHR